MVNEIFLLGRSAYLLINGQIYNKSCSPILE
jgi:hypothetical protein